MERLRVQADAQRARRAAAAKITREGVKKLLEFQPTSTPPPLPPEAIDPTEYPSMRIGGRLVERLKPIACPRCGRGGGHLFIVRSADSDPHAPRSLHDDRIGGRLINWRSDARCPSCRVLGHFKDTLKTRRVDRGIHRQVIDGVRKWCMDKRTRMGELEGEILAEIATINKGDWIARTAFEDHPYAATIAPLIINLEVDASPPGSLFRTGRLEIEYSGLHVPRPEHDTRLEVRMPLVWELVDAHAAGKFEGTGLAKHVSAESRFCPSLATTAETNTMTLEAGYGPLQSRFEQSVMIKGRRWVIEVTTFLDGTFPPTTYLTSTLC